MKDEKYNGWRNYATWCVNIWLSNDEGDYRHFSDLASEAIEEARLDLDLDDEDPSTGAVYERATRILAKAMESECDDAAPTEIKGMWADLLTAAYGQVDWHEIAQEWIEAAREEESK